jgi:RNA polymerase sigma-70 factor (ECF subfamily)
LYPDPDPPALAACDLLPDGCILVPDMSTFAIEVPDPVIARLKAGDHAALEQVYRLFERPAFTLAWRLLGDRDEAQEVLHDAMLCLIDRIGQFRGDAPFWGWLRQICVNESLMRLRKRRLDYVDELPEPEAVARPLEPAIERADLERALDRLSPTARSVVWLYYVEGYTHEEIARNFDRTVSFSKTQLARGTAKLRDLLKVGQGATAYA